MADELSPQNRIRIEVDRGLCIGSGDCVDTAPEVFELDEEDKARVIDPDGEPYDVVLEAAGELPGHRDLRLRRERRPLPLSPAASASSATAARGHPGQRADCARRRRPALPGAGNANSSAASTSWGFGSRSRGTPGSGCGMANSSAARMSCGSSVPDGSGGESVMHRTLPFGAVDQAHAHRSRGRRLPAPRRAPAGAHGRAEHRPDGAGRLLSELPLALVPRGRRGARPRAERTPRRARSSTECPTRSGRRATRQSSAAERRGAGAGRRAGAWRPAGGLPRRSPTGPTPSPCSTRRRSPPRRPESRDRRSRPQVVQLEGAGRAARGQGRPAGRRAQPRAPRPTPRCSAELRRGARRARRLQAAPVHHRLPPDRPPGPGPARRHRGGARRTRPDVVKRVILAGNEIAKFPYKWGGGHGAWRDTGYDCSGSVSFALAAAGMLDRPLTSGAFLDWGTPGPGEWITIYTNPGHIFMVVAGLRFDTSGQGRAGTRWQDGAAQHRRLLRSPLPGALGRLGSSPGTSGSSRTLALAQQPQHHPAADQLGHHQALEVLHAARRRRRPPRGSGPRGAGRRARPGCRARPRRPRRTSSAAASSRARGGSGRGPPAMPR